MLPFSWGSGPKRTVIGMRKGEFLLKALRRERMGGVILVLVTFALVLLVGDWALAQTNQGQQSPLESEVRRTVGSIVCEVTRIVKGPLARLISLAIFVGAVLYYMTSDSRTAKALAVAAVVGLILFNTLETWQQIFTGESYQQLCTPR